MRFVRVLLMLASLSYFVAAANAQTQTFVRTAQIPADSLDVGGWGNIVAGVDFDNDGKKEIYAVNNDWHDVAGKDLIPRIYKYEQDGTAWKRVWSTALNIPLQNTWPALTWGDLDKDGKKEIIWGPVNNINATTNPNPARICVFESKGDGSDIMGVDIGGGRYKPNAKWTITDQANQNIRPYRWFINDIDKDGKDEIVASLRAGTPRCQIYSVSNIPDNGDSTETWALEFSGTTGTNYDLAIVDSTFYLINDVGGVTPVTRSATGGGSYVVGATQAALVPGGSWKTSSVVDIDGDGVKEIVVAGSFSGAATNQVWVLQRDAAALKATPILDLPLASGRIYGGASGDLDGNGRIDFVFGSRESTPRGLIHRLEYKGGAITDPNSYTLTRIDSLAGAIVTQFDVITIANLDNDPELEIAYTGTPREKTATDPPQPIVILDLQKALPVELASFTIAVIGNSADLNWTTTTETNNYGFEVQRGVDQTDFQKIGFVAGNGTTTTQHSYKFSDRGLTAGTYYYRLKQIDTDGTISLSQAVRADIVAAVREYTLHQNYPNPFNPTTTIAFDLKEDGFVKLRVFNMLGQLVAELVNGQLKAGAHNAILDARNLASGTYLYLLEVNNFRSQKRLQIVK